MQWIYVLYVSTRIRAFTKTGLLSRKLAKLNRDPLLVQNLIEQFCSHEKRQGLIPQVDAYSPLDGQTEL